MNSSGPIPPKVVILLFLFFALLLGLGLGRSGFEGRDERRYAQVSKEIGPGRDLLVMHYLGGPYPDKPPLFFWMQAVCFKALGGVSPFAARLPLFGSSMLALLFAFLFIRRLHGDTAAIAGTILLLLGFRFFWSARWARLDMTMTAFTFGSFWASSRLLFPDRHETSEGGVGWKWAMLAWFFGALAVLSKGPGVLVWLGGVATFAAVKRDSAIIRRHHPIAGFLLMLGIVCLWFVPAAILGGRDYWGPMLKVHVVERAVGVVRHNQPWYYYFKMLYDAMPLGPLIPVALWFGWWRRRTGHDPDGRLLFPLSAFVFGFVFFSLPAGKRGQYVLPLYLPAASLAGAFAAEALSGRTQRLKRMADVHAALLNIGLLIAAFASPWLYTLVEEDFPTPPDALGYVVLCGMLTMVLFPGFLFALRGRLALSLACCASAVAGIYMVFFLVLMPSNRTDAVPLSVVEHVTRECGDWRNFGLYGVDEKFTLYGPSMPVLLKNIDEAKSFMNLPGRRVLLVHSRKLPRLVDESGVIPWRQAGEWRDPGDGRKIHMFATGQ